MLKTFFVNFLIIIYILTSGCATDTENTLEGEKAAPVLHTLSVSGTEATSVILDQPIFSTTCNPEPTVEAYIGIDGVISISESTAGNYTHGPVDVSSGSYRFQGLNEDTTYRIIVVARNSEGFSVKETTRTTLTTGNTGDDSEPDPETEPVKVLFIGNSYTSSNSLPVLVSRFANGLGDSIEYDSRTRGAYWFADHKDDATTLSKINSKDWDFIVLQNQSQVPGWKPDAVTANSLPNAQALCDEILTNNAETKIIYFQTWGRENGDAQNCGYYPLVCTYDGHTQALIEGYNIYADNTAGEIAPVGASWKLVVDDNDAPFSGDNLWSDDGSHPALHGSYLAAAVIYGTISSSSVTGCSYTAGLDTADAVYLQQQADIAISQL